MLDPIFSIKNLNCEYVKNKPVLRLEELEIGRGKLIFLIGKSGIGKSTFIETLGLMNNTIASLPDTKITFYPSSDSAAVEIQNAWERSNKELSEFRKKNFSFIFQNTNLMPNFTAGENMMMGLLLDGENKSTAKAKVLDIMRQLSLPPEIFDSKISELSGGQRQRLAFVRAVTSKFSVLFGDEPTGNLDEKTADELMSILKSIIKKESKTGLIVSHDLRLAMKFADVILPIQSKDDGTLTYGTVANKNMLTNNGTNWISGAGEEIKDCSKVLESYIH